MRGETNVFAVNPLMYYYETIRRWIRRVMKIQQRRKRKAIRG
jgi:predicted ATP-binding protein involved in virulence